MIDTKPPLRLVALDADDLAVVSAHVQDAILKVGDLSWLPKERRFALLMNRFAWEAAEAGRRPVYERRRAALHFDRVLAVQSMHLRRNASDAVLEMLAIGFEPDDPPAGHITLTFAGGAVIRLAVECIEAQLADLGAAWQTKAKPTHDLSDRSPGT